MTKIPPPARARTVRPFLATTLAALLIGAASSASAEVSISVIAPDPDDTEGVFQDPANLEMDFLVGGEPANTTKERDIDSNRDNAQSFTVTSDFVLDKIAINYQALNLGGNDTTFEFFRVADAKATTLAPEGDILESFTFNASNAAFSGVSATHGTLVFDITDLAVEAGDMFAIRFDTDAGTSHSIKWRYFNSAADSYADGEAYEGNSSTAGPITAKVYSFGLVAVGGPTTSDFAITDITVTPDEREVSITFNSVAGKLYDIERSFALESFEPIAEIIATGPTTTFTRSGVKLETREFFRVVDLGEADDIENTEP